MKERISPLYIAFVTLMVLIIAVGVFMLIYGSMHNGIPVPSVPGGLQFAEAAFHG
ncbi:MAG: hypothetical protein IJ343_06515 [Clostridia bacterium]|nr:hypothetical protein [Clostridia bacterium]